MCSSDLRTTESPMNHTLPTTQNPEWGFFGTMAHHADPAATWPIAMTAIIEATGCADYEVRAFLDSRHGRHFADDVANGLTRGESFDAAIAEATERWMGWRISARPCCSSLLSS